MCVQTVIYQGLYIYLCLHIGPTTITTYYCGIENEPYLLCISTCT